MMAKQRHSEKRVSLRAANDSKRINDDVDIPAPDELEGVEIEMTDSLEEEDDNPYQESDEALPDDKEEAAIRRNPSREGGRFDEV